MGDDRDNSNDNSKKTTSMSEFLNEALAVYRSFDVKKTVGAYREKLNQEVFDNPSLKKIQHWPHKPKEISAEIDRDLRALSIQFNNEYPYAASLCRSHPTLILGTFLAVTVFPLWSRPLKFKTVAVMFAGLAAVGQGSLTVINYQWTHDKSVPADPAMSKKST